MYDHRGVSSCPLISTRTGEMYILYNLYIVYVLYMLYTMYMNGLRVNDDRGNQSFENKFANNLDDPIDLTPFYEPIKIRVERNAAGGWTCKTRFHINFRWATECKYVESNRMFGHKGEMTDEIFKKECLTAIADLQEKRLWIFKANHGLLDREGDSFSGKIRFKA